MNSDILICSQALILLGEKPISSFDDKRSTAQICGNVYPSLKATILSAHPWRFAMTKSKLSQDSTPPIGEWEYSHVIPGAALSGGVHAVFIGVQNELASGNYEVFGRRIYSNYKEIWADYKIDVHESLFPETFARLMAYALASDIAFAVTDQQSVADSMGIKAYGLPSDNGVGGMMGAALALEAQSQGNIGLRNDAFTDARHASGGYDDFRNM